MLAAIAAAEREVLLESYILADDATGRGFIDALVAAAARGALVRLIVDGVGTLGRLPAARLAAAERAGVGVLVYRPVAPWRRRWGLWRRDHRKLLAVDGRLGFLGGLNLADEYDDRCHNPRPWRDLHLSVEGPAVGELVRLFTGTWNAEVEPHARLAPPSLRSPHPPAGPEVGGAAVQVIGSRFWPRGGLIRRSFLRAVHSANHRVLIANAYFIPDRGIVRALKEAVGRGAQVKVVIPYRSDVLLVDLATRAMLGPLLRAGVRVAEWPHGMMHSKAASVDGAWATVGSFNLDHRSLRHNLEVTANVFDPQAAAAVEARLEEDFSCATEIQVEALLRRPLSSRLLSWLAYQVRWWL